MKIEAGKNYIARDGELWKAARIDSRTRRWTLTDERDEEYWFHGDGAFGHAEPNCRHDLVSEATS